MHIGQTQYRSGKQWRGGVEWGWFIYLVSCFWPSLHRPPGNYYVRTHDLVFLSSHWHTCNFMNTLNRATKLCISGGSGGRLQTWTSQEKMLYHSKVNVNMLHLSCIHWLVVLSDNSSFQWIVNNNLWQFYSGNTTVEINIFEMYLFSCFGTQNSKGENKNMWIYILFMWRFIFKGSPPGRSKWQI